MFDGVNFIGIDRLEKYKKECAIIQSKKGNTFVLSEYRDKEKIDIMQVKNGRLHLPRMKVDKKIFEDKVVDVFSNLEKSAVDNLFEIVQYASKQSHGTTIVVMDKTKAEQETTRLKGASTEIEIRELVSVDDDDLIYAITSIDGAVIVDTDGNCHAIGVILDGTITVEGNRVEVLDIIQRTHMLIRTKMHYVLCSLRMGI